MMNEDTYKPRNSRGGDGTMHKSSVLQSRSGGHNKSHRWSHETGDSGGILAIGFISNSQNGLVIYPTGISGCICSGGKGHDSFTPRILEIYEDTL